MTIVKYATPSDLVVFVDWFAARLPGAVESGDAHKAGQIARGIAHFARQLPPPKKLRSRRAAPPPPPPAAPLPKDLKMLLLVAVVGFAMLSAYDQLLGKNPPPQETREDAPGEF